MTCIKQFTCKTMQVVIFIQVMDDSFERIIKSLLPGVLANIIQVPESVVNLLPAKDDSGLDFYVKVPGQHFLVECKSTSARAPLLIARQQIMDFRASFAKDAIPLIVVPYMGKSGIDFCLDNGLSWVDLSGNAHIKAPGLLIHIEGRPNIFKKVGRPANVFAPKSARIARQLLIKPENKYSQRDLSQITGLDEGHTSKIVHRLEEFKLIQRDEDGALNPSDPGHLLDAWLEAYDFSKHQIIKGHIAARSGEELLNQITRNLAEKKVNYALTGLAGAWLYTHFAKFRLVTLYLNELPDKKLLDRLHFREDDFGANTWLVVPKDIGVFDGRKDIDNIVCVHPVQVYLDLKDQPERAKEAAEQLRRECLKWRRDD
jgi:hypothetical protein